MNLVGVVAISVLAALFLFALLAATGVLVWLALRIRKDQAAEQQSRSQVYAETGKLMGAQQQRNAESYADATRLYQSQQAELKAVIESAKSGFGSIRTDIRSSLEVNQKNAEAALASHQQALTATLDTFRADINAAIAKINADALATVAVRLTQVCIRAEKAIAVFQQLILNTEQNPGADYAPDAYAPEESAFGAPPSGYAVSQTARMDQEADIESGAEVVSEAI